jgi:hypothetical protein
MLRLSLVAAVLAACTDCPVTHEHDETYVSTSIAGNQIDQCHNEAHCISLCVHAFQLDYAQIDRCVIQSMDANGARVAVDYSVAGCTADDVEVDVDVPFDPCDDGSCDPPDDPPPDDPCNDGSCDPPPDDPPDDPPPDDPPPDDGSSRKVPAAIHASMPAPQSHR